MATLNFDNTYDILPPYDAFVDLAHKVLMARHPGRREFSVYEVMDVLLEVGIETYVDEEGDEEEVFCW